MTTLRLNLRKQAPVNYVESESSDSTPPNSASDIESDFSQASTDEESNSTPPSPLTPKIDATADTITNNEEVIEGLRRSGRVRKTRVESIYPHRKQLATHKISKPKTKITLISARNKLRATIELQTRSKENNFLVYNRDYFFPLLPEVNYISKLIASEDETMAIGKVIPFEELDFQPVG